MPKQSSATKLVVGLSLILLAACASPVASPTPPPPLTTPPAPTPTATATETATQLPTPESVATSATSKGPSPFDGLNLANVNAVITDKGFDSNGSGCKIPTLTGQAWEVPLQEFIDVNGIYRGSAISPEYLTSLFALETDKNGAVTGSWNGRKITMVGEYQFADDQGNMFIAAQPGNFGFSVLCQKGNDLFLGATNGFQKLASKLYPAFGKPGEIAVRFGYDQDPTAVASVSLERSENGLTGRLKVIDLKGNITYLKFIGDGKTEKVTVTPTPAIATPAPIPTPDNSIVLRNTFDDPVMDIVQKNSESLTKHYGFNVLFGGTSPVTALSEWTPGSGLETLDFGYIANNQKMIIRINTLSCIRSYKGTLIKGNNYLYATFAVSDNQVTEAQISSWLKQRSEQLKLKNCDLNQIKGLRTISSAKILSAFNKGIAPEPEYKQILSDGTIFIDLSGYLLFATYMNSF
jgi:hypothetical protein